MPGTTYASTDFNSYKISKPINPAFDDILWKIMYVNFNMYGVQTLPSDSSNPVELNLLVEKGNYKVECYINGPDGLMIRPIIVNVYTEGDTIYQCIPYMLDVYYRYGVINEGGVCNWGDWQTAFNSSCPIYAGSTEPDELTTPFALWIDTRIPLYPVIRGYKSDLGWFGVGSLIDVMYAKIYDTETKFRDAFLYFEEKVGMIKFNIDGTYTILDADHEKIGAYYFRERYVRHLDLGHMSVEEREYFDNLISKEEFDKIYEEYKAYFIQYATERITGKIPSLIEAINNEENRIRTHRDDQDAHMNLKLKDYWNKKAEVDHTHFSDYNVRIDASQIKSGIISPDRLPSTIIENLVRIRTHKARFSLSTFDVQNGDSVYVDEENDQYEAGLYLVYDMYKLDKDEGWIHYRTRKLANIDFEDIGKRPNTYEGYGIENAAPSLKNSSRYEASSEYPEFVYPYKEEGNTFNYLLYQRVSQFVYNFEKVLWDINNMIHNYDIQPIYVFIQWNKESDEEITNKWTPYATIEGNQIPAQHTLNEGTHASVEEVYNRMYDMMY